MNNDLITMLNTLANSGKNPEQLVQLLLKQNPNANLVMQQIKNMKGNRSMRDFALQMAKQQGYDVKQVEEMAHRLGAK